MYFYLVYEGIVNELIVCSKNTSAWEPVGGESVLQWLHMHTLVCLCWREWKLRAPLLRLTHCMRGCDNK